MVNKEMLQLGTQRSVIRELFEYGKQRSAQVGAEHVFDFSLGNPNTPAPSLVNQTAIQLLETQGIHSYTSAPGDPGARERFVASINRLSTQPYHWEELYLTVGAAAALTCCIRALCCPGDEFILFAPYFPEYQVFIASAGGKALVVPPQYPDFQPDFSAFRQSISPKTKAVLVNTPNNPSGAVYSPASLRKLSAILQEKSQEYGHPIYLISDEPYRELVYDGSKPTWVAEYYADTLVCYSYSKSLSLPGERIGYVLVGSQVSQGKEVYAAIAGAGRAMGYVNAPSLFQQVCSYASEAPTDTAFYQKNRDILLSALQDYGFSIPPAQGAFYLFPCALEEDDQAFCLRARDYDLLLVPGSGFGTPGYFRIAY